MTSYSVSTDLGETGETPCALLVASHGWGVCDDKNGFKSDSESLGGLGDLNHGSWAIKNKKWPETANIFLTTGTHSSWRFWHHFLFLQSFISLYDYTTIITMVWGQNNGLFVVCLWFVCGYQRFIFKQPGSSKNILCSWADEQETSWTSSIWTFSQPTLVKHVCMRVHMWGNSDTLDVVWIVFLKFV